MNYVEAVRNALKEKLNVNNYPQEKVLELFDKFIASSYDDESDITNPQVFFDYMGIEHSFNNIIFSIPRKYINDACYLASHAKLEDAFEIINFLVEYRNLLKKKEYYLSMANYSHLDDLDRCLIHLVNQMGEGDMFVTFDFKIDFAKRFIVYNIYSINSNIENGNKVQHLEAMKEFFKEYTKRIWKESIEVVDFNIICN